MGKLGKKARKFAKKNLQSVLRRKRKLKSIFNRKSSSRNDVDTAEDQGQKIDLSNGRNFEGEAFEGTSFDAIVSDGFLTEDMSCPYIAETENENDSEENICHIPLLGQNQEIHLELMEKKMKLDRLKKKDPEFSNFLDSHIKDLEQFGSEENLSGGDVEISNHGTSIENGGGLNLNESKVLASSTIDSWCEFVLKQNRVHALPSLLNGYRAACHYGTDVTCRKIEKSETFCKILMFMLCEADNIFRRQLGISNSNCKDTILPMMNSSKWKTMKPLIKSYLRSTVFLLNQVTDSGLLSFTITRLRASIVFFTAFPPLLQRLVKVAVQLWATGGGTVSSSAFFVMHDLACLCSSDFLDPCLVKAYKAFIAHCKFVEPANMKHMQFLGDSFVDLCSVDILKSYSKALLFIQELAKILQHGLTTKKKEVLKKICSWQYINCINLWVKFLSKNIKDHDLQPLLYLIIQIISGVAYLFPGPRYLLLRFKCIQMLNELSISSGVFIPITSLALGALEYCGSGRAGARPEKAFDFSFVLKVPKQWLKSQCFQGECVLSAIKLLSMHLSQWSCHISFPELATITLIFLKKFHEKATSEVIRHRVKHLIDQVQRNVEYVQKKRDEVAFSPKDEESVESFLEFEKCSRNDPFTQYYTRTQQKSISQNISMKEKTSMVESQESKKHKLQTLEEGFNGEKYFKKGKVNSIVGTRDRRRKKPRT
uniref:Nucleolar complex protein 2 homolog n=1 Tax=Nelumbo nucifera TaxID=4432 RepID=A0A822YEL6_NELNU|nr:TPA_asm: hypothetical protein HUJ06_011465 [Nelumbo nucifera]